MILTSKMQLYVIGIFIFISVCAKNTGAVVCKSQWQAYMEKCYLRYNTYVVWKSGMLSCIRYGQLITIDNDGLNTFIQQNITNGSDVWLGLTNGNVDSISEWTWSDGQSVTYTDDWDGNPVYSFCVTMVLTGDEKTPHWNTRLCTSNYGVVCEKDMVNNICDETWLEYEMHCYFIVLETRSKMNNMVAARYCWDQHAYIVSINNQSEAEFLYRNVQPGTEYWIGLSPLKWLDGTPLQWNNWDELGPDKDSSCVYMDHLTGKWTSGECDGGRRFVCQYDIPGSTTMSHMSTQFSSPPKSKDITIQAYDETTMHDYNTNSDEELPDDIVSTTSSGYTTSEISHSSTERVHKSTTISFTNISKETTGISFNHDINVYIAVIAVLVVIVIGFIIAVTILVIYFKRRLSAKEPNFEGSAVYYNEVSDRSNAKQEHNDNRPNERLSVKELNSETSAVYYNDITSRPNENGDKGNISANDRNMYEHLSTESHGQSEKITTGDYASLQ